jgi:hypothetical protein
VQEVYHSAGGGQPDTAVFELHDTWHQREEPLQDIDPRSFIGAIAEITRVSENIQQEKVIHFGPVTAVHLARQQDGEYLVMISRFNDAMMGNIVRGPTYLRDHNNAKTATLFIGEPLIFNPAVDGRAVPNMSTRGITGKSHLALVHPDQLPRSSLTANNWEQVLRSTDRVRYAYLPDIVRYLCWTLNEEQTYVLNPLNVHLDTVLAGFEAPVNKEIYLGSTLPEALDELLQPYGIIWHVQYDTLGTRRMWLRSHAHPAGTGTIRVQRYREPVDQERDNVPSFHFSYDAEHRTANNIWILGSRPVKEVTFNLTPAWDQTYDALPLETLAEGSVERQLDSTLDRVWREFVANETGEYNGLRDNHAFLGPQLLDAVFGEKAWIRRRRPMLACITSANDGMPVGNGGIVLEYYDYDVNEWLIIDRLENAGFQPLEGEIGIRFTNDLPPQQLYDQGTDYTRLRVTASFEGDSRIWVRSRTDHTTSLIPDRRAVWLDMEGRYHAREITEHSRFDGEEGWRQTEIDDTVEMGRLSDQVLVQWDQAMVDGSLTLEGVDWIADLGGVILGLGDRLVPLNAKSEASGVWRYPLVTAVHYNFDQQTIRVQLDSPQQSPAVFVESQIKQRRRKRQGWVVRG